MEQSSSTHVVIQTTRSTSIQSFCTKPLIRCHHHHVPPNPFALLDTPLLREPTRLPPLALILYSDRTVQYRPQHLSLFLFTVEFPKVLLYPLFFFYFIFLNCMKQCILPLLVFLLWDLQMIQICLLLVTL